MDNQSQSGAASAAKIGGFLKSKRGERIILSALSALALLFTVIFFSVKFTDFDFAGVKRGDQSFWSASVLYVDNWRLGGFNVYFIIAFMLCAVLYAAAIIRMFLGSGKKLFTAAAACNAVIDLACLIVGIALKILRGGAIFCCIVSIVLCMAMLAYLLVLFRSRATGASAKAETEEPEPESPLTAAKRKLISRVVLIFDCAALVILALIFFIPLCSVNADGTKTSYILITALSDYSVPVYIAIAFVAAMLVFFAEVLYFAATVCSYQKSKNTFAVMSDRFIKSITAFTLVFFVFGYCLTFFFNAKYAATGIPPVGGGDDLIGLPYSVSYSTVSFIPFLISVATLIAYSVFGGRLNESKPTQSARKAHRVEPMIWAAAITAVTFVSLALNIVKINVVVGGNVVQDVALSGYRLLSAYKTLEGGFQVLAFLEFAVLVMSGILFATVAVTFLSKDKNYYKAVKLCAVANFLFVLMIGLFGVYFKIAQKINIENIKSVLKYFQIEISDAYEYNVKSQTMFMLIASAVIIVGMLFRGIFSLGAQKTGDGDVAPNAAQRKPAAAAVGVNTASSAADMPDFDACPAFTELDGMKPKFRAELESKREHLFASPTLPSVVRFVVDYARECRLHLSYTLEDIATFVAGLGASRLTILQGMSGTGKTSLPKIFAEALMGNCEIVEVESSWRDKNELLGYYNEFSKCFTPKKFTQVLYKARLNPEVPTLIVLDEMNLSRIEYYFSDFLSLMEHEEDKREIKLLNVKLFRTENGSQIPYDGLTDGHTVKIPSNVWFIGTANRDESTFEISDKVYDRAQTMNFDKRAPKIRSFGEPLDQRFLTYDALAALLDEGRNYRFEAEDNPAVQKTEKLLAPYNISFGNRILKQMEDFVKIYCSCFGDRAAAESDAVERILLSKVVSKLETKVVENKDALAAEFDKLGLKKCAAFVRRLNED